MKFERIASAHEDMDDHYAVVVIGSGYGASVAASRLARAGQRVGVFERGREILPGDYPDTLLEAGRETQVDSRRGHHGDRASLFSFHIGDDISVLSGVGLGGTSLINAGVALEADPRVFDEGWPQALKDDVDHGLAGGSIGLGSCSGRIRSWPRPDRRPSTPPSEPSGRRSVTASPGRRSTSP